MKRSCQPLRCVFAVVAPLFVLLAIPVLLTGGMAFAENIDPSDNGSQYAWAENLGWINFEPSGPGGPGVLVSDSALTGWAWSENAGWISLSCMNVSCAGSSYGVTNDAAGTNVLLTWIAVSGATPFEIVRGGLSVLRSTNGNFQTAVHPCIVNDTTNTSASTGGEINASGNRCP